MATKDDEGVDRRKQELPEHLMIEILLKLPAKSLSRFKCVSKDWYNLIFSPSFLAMLPAQNAYLDNHNNKSVPIFYHSHKPNEDLSSTTISLRLFHTPLEITIPLYVNDNIEIVGCSNGLVCLSLSERQSSYGLLNPATQQFRQIESVDNSLVDGDRFSVTCGLCFDHVANTLKLVQVGLPSRSTPSLPLTTNLEVDIFALKTNTWRRKTLNLPCPLPNMGYISGLECIRRHMYWTVKIHFLNYAISDKWVLCFDMVLEVFTRIEVPSEAGLEGKLANYNDSLAMFGRQTDNSYIVWRLNTNDSCGATGKYSWTKLVTFASPLLARCLPIGIFVKGDANMVVLFDCVSNHISCCNLDLGEIQVLSRTGNYGSQFFSYRESLASVVNLRDDE